ncbi:MAG: ROK family protein [Nitriliruptorales bacterium]|nr:ROK family protein [Nitriliruptorales bacterium]
MAQTPASRGSGLAVGIDVGGTKVAAGLVAADGTVVDYLRRETPAEESDAICDLIADTARELREAHGLRALPVGVGAAGLIDLDGVVRYAPNISWRGYPLRERLAARIDAPVRVHNDANVAAWGEYRAGAGVDARSTLLMLTIGTGVGGGLVVDDHLTTGAYGFGAEFGHIVLDEGGPRCNCGNRGDLEALASGSAIGRMAVEAAESGRVPEGSLLHGASPLTGKVVTIAAHDGDEIAREIIATAGFWLGVGIGSLINAIDPEIVVLGGGAMQAGELLLAPARAAAAERIMGGTRRPVPPIVSARLGDMAGLVGAGLLAMDDRPPASGRA